MPHVHGGGAGVVGLAPQAHRPLEQAGDAVHHSHRHTRPGQHGPLLDVQLEVGVDVTRRSAGIQQPQGIQPAGAHLIRQRHPVLPHQMQRLRGEEPAHGLRPQHAAEPALLVTERDELDGRRRRDARLHQHPQALQPAQHAQRAVQHARPRHGVGVGADHHGRAIRRAQARMHVARAVHGHRQPRGGRAIHQPAPPPHVGLGEGHAVDAPVVRVPPDLAERQHVGLQAVDINAHGRNGGHGPPSWFAPRLPGRCRRERHGRVARAWGVHNPPPSGGRRHPRPCPRVPPSDDGRPTGR